MRYARFLLAALASAALVKAAAIPDGDMGDDCEEYPAPPSSKAPPPAPHSSKAPPPAPHSSKKSTPVVKHSSTKEVPTSTKKSSKKPTEKPTSTKKSSKTPTEKPTSVKKSSKKPTEKPTSVKKTTKHSSHHSSKVTKKPYPVFTKTVIIVVEEFTVVCPKPTILIEATETVTVTAPTTVTFCHGPYTRTEYELSCYTTTTTVYEEASCSGWPYETGMGYTPIECPEVYPTPAPSYAYVAPVPAPAPYEAPAPAPAPAYVAAVPAPAPGNSSYSGPTLYTSGAAQSGASFIVLVAGIVAAIMVL